MTLVADHAVECVQSAGAGTDWSGFAATLLAAALAAVVAVVGYIIQRKIARRSERADLYADALGAVEVYLEGPYRIRRKTKDPNNWSALSSALSDCKTAVSHHQALLRLHAPAAVAVAYDQFVNAAQREAGPKMTEAWSTPPLKRPRDVPLGVGYRRSNSDARRAELVDAMSTDLAAIGSWWRLTR
ncbi:MAG: hypothetical protein WBD41_00720 [Rhodococcus sp. (in: high G+C Gram-positive bacteria)]|uniref:hypothetical protein n=1 Tax=Rhodococcus sp. EPR-157 TaxID=1813677 RepID=UPI0007BBF153|nr:hypothetical protein [Rhodococcus sp. EPR-157]KZF04498.1 hypothetical protein A2J03_26250 [Rhodococcus sp. EPR-157]